MLKKLKSALKNPTLQSLLKAGIIGILLFFGPLGWLGKIGFVALVGYFFLPIGQFWASLAVFLAVSLMASQWSFGSLGFLGFGAFSLFFALIFFLMLGIKNLIFINRNPYYHFLNNALFLLVFLVFFTENKFSFISVGHLAVFGACFLLFKEFFNFVSRLEANKLQIMPLKANLLAFGQGLEKLLPYSPEANGKAVLNL